METSRFITLGIAICVFVGPMFALELKPAPIVLPDPNISSVKWYRTYEAGIALADEKKMPVLLFFGAPGCGWCDAMERNVFPEDSVRTYLRNYVCIRMDTEKNVKPAFAYAVYSVPRIFVVNTHKEIVGDWLGYRDGEQLTALLKEIAPKIRQKTGLLQRPKVVSGNITKSNIPDPVIRIPDVPEQLLELLGHRNAAVRSKAMDALVQKGRDALPLLLSALKDKYLGVRIAAWKALRKLGVTKIDFDPWGKSEEREKIIIKLEDQLVVRKQEKVKTQ